MSKEKNTNANKRKKLTVSCIVVGVALVQEARPELVVVHRVEANENCVALRTEPIVVLVPLQHRGELRRVEGRGEALRVVRALARAVAE